MNTTSFPIFLMPFGVSTLHPNPTRVGLSESGRAQTVHKRLGATRGGRRQPRPSRFHLHRLSSRRRNANKPSPLELSPVPYDASRITGPLFISCLPRPLYLDASLPLGVGCEGVGTRTPPSPAVSRDKNSCHKSTYLVVYVHGNPLGVDRANP